MDYIPKPIDTSHWELPNEVQDLVELLANNVHEVWAQERMNEGWTYGPERDDALKQTPCLVPYDQLEESEKDYDRNTAIGTLKLILKSGYVIKRRRGK